MRRPEVAWGATGLLLVLSAIPVAWLEAVRFVAGAPFTWAGLVCRWSLVGGLLVTSLWTRPHAVEGTTIVWPWTGVAALIAGVGAAVLYIADGSSWTAWALLPALNLTLLGLERGLTERTGFAWRWPTRGLLLLLGGAVPIAISQVESRFAGEEFIVVLQALVMTIFWTLLMVAQRLLAWRDSALLRSGMRLDRQWIGLAVLLLTLIGLGMTARAYQRSFYPSEVPAFEGISAETPFLCGQAPLDPQTYDGEDVFQRLLARVAANPNAGAPEYGMLALATEDQQWAMAFRETLLGEAAEGSFSGPAHSVKSVQYEAALRAYYFPRVRDAFPNLFSDQDLVLLLGWFAAINERVQTIEPVDWMYALAFAKLPEGPYENQENGAGLLALLETEGLAATDLSLANRDYLEHKQRGWMARFRNTDDALIYQPQWITNAYLQSLYTDEVVDDNMGMSFEWLLLQALSDGARMSYNHPGRYSFVSIAYLGAGLLNDPRFVWLAGRALEEVERQGEYLYAQPGVERPVLLTGHSPAEGSCLLYGDSGLPNQAGPLAPDKIVFRDNWSGEGAYVLINLRFTGWHRYKATNTITLVYQGSSLAADNRDGQPLGWVPVGRRAFRDKRIPRENLNGLLIERSGMDAVLYHLSGIGGPWAQDPPFYADVMAFEMGEEFDWSWTQLIDWRGWQHDRWIYFYHGGGPIVVVDEALGPPGRQAALAWHLAAGVPTADRQRIALPNGDAPAEALVVPLDTSGNSSEVILEHGGGSLSHVYIQAPPNGRLRVATLFLLGDWVGAEATLHPETQTLQITQGQKHIALSLSMGE